MPPCRADVAPQRTSLEGDKLSSSNDSIDDEGRRRSIIFLEKKEHHHHHHHRHHQYDPILKTLYIVTAYLCFAMVFWIMIAPGSWLIRRSRFHKEFVIPFLEEQGWFFLVVPKHFITKFQHHDLVHLTHLLPSAIWAVIIPFQLHPTFRNQHKRLHRFLGYTFLLAVILVTIGVFIILKRKLTFHHFFPDLEPQSFRRDEIQKFALGGMSLWYAYTAIRAVQIMAFGRRGGKSRTAEVFVGQYNSSSSSSSNGSEMMTNVQLQHQKWMYRHVASGIWIVVQRMVIIPIAIGYYHFISTTKPSQWIQREIFLRSAESAWILCFCLGEYAHQRVVMRMMMRRKRPSSSSSLSLSDELKKSNGKSKML